MNKYSLPLGEGVGALGWLCLGRGLPCRGRICRICVQDGGFVPKQKACLEWDWRESYFVDGERTEFLGWVQQDESACFSLDMIGGSAV